MVREEDRPALKRIIKTIFSVENDHRVELDAIIRDESLTMEERGEKYLDTICDHLEYAPNND